MPTTRTRRVRVSRRLPAQLTERDIGRLKLKDFLGRLEGEEIQAAEAHGVYKWDQWVKARREQRRKWEGANEPE